MELLESLDRFGPVLLPTDPSSLDMNDERTLEELATDEIERIRRSLYKTLNVNPQLSDTELRRYDTTAHPKASVPGKIEVIVFKTNNEGVFLQELIFQDANTRWVIGPDQDI